MSFPIRHYQLSSYRSRETGAALFVVVMVITLLTAVGIFAARATSMVDAATGYARQAAQTQALADYGSKLVASELGQGRADRVFQILSNPNLAMTQLCPSYAATPATPVQPCYPYDYSQLEQRVNQNTGNAAGVIQPQTGTNEGSLGPRIADASMGGIDGVFIVELFDPFDISNIKGESASKPSGKEVTLNSNAQVRPFTSTTAPNPLNSQWCSNGPSSTAASLLSVRAQVIVPGL
jgi:hypothetical protein